MKYKAVIFDFDDTLVETHAIKFEHHKAVAKKFYNIDLTREKFLEHFGKPFNTLISELYNHSDTLENMVTANLTLKHEYPKKIFPETLNVLNTLLNKDVKIGILTATNLSLVVDDLQRIGAPAERLTIIQGPEETDFHKPDPRVFEPLLARLEKMGIDKKDMVYVGDHINDYLAASGAGIDFIGVATGIFSEEELRSKGVKNIVGSLEEILEKITQ